MTNDRTNNPELFVIGTDGQVNYHKIDASGNATGGYLNGATVAGGLSAIDSGVGLHNHPGLFAVFSSANQVYLAY